MKSLLLILMLLTGAGLSAQNFYVAIVKGKVFYDDKPLMPRDKIELKGNLRFSTPDDYVKISGPTGIHTVRPLEKDGGGFEFLRAVKAELFPAAKPLNSFVLSTHIYSGDMIGINDANEWIPEYFVSGERISLKGKLKKRDQKKIRWIYQTESGTFHQAIPKIVGREIELRAADFRQHPPEDSIINGTAYLFLIRDPEDFQNLSQKQSLNDIYEATSPDLNGTDLNTAGVVSLAPISAYGVIPSEEVMPDLVFALIASGLDDTHCFMLPNYCMLDAEGYYQILREQHGEMNFSRINEAVVDYLGERRKEDPRYLELWKLNRRR